MLWPVAALVALTFYVLVITFLSRKQSVENGEVPISYYRLFRGAEPTDRVVQYSNHFRNLFEMPVLFYLVCLLSIVMRYETVLMVALAWLYVVLRLAHSYIHLTYNNVMHRLYAFALSNAVIAVMFVVLLLNRGMG